MPKEPNKDEQKGLDIFFEKVLEAFIEDKDRFEKGVDLNNTANFMELMTYAYRNAMTQLVTDKM